MSRLSGERRRTRKLLARVDESNPGSRESATQGRDSDGKAVISDSAKQSIPLEQPARTKTLQSSMSFKDLRKGLCDGSLIDTTGSQLLMQGASQQSKSQTSATTPTEHFITLSRFFDRHPRVYHRQIDRIEKLVFKSSSRAANCTVYLTTHF